MNSASSPNQLGNFMLPATAWGSELDANSVIFNFSSAAELEIVDFFKSAPALARIQSPTDVEKLVASSGDFARCRQDIANLIGRLETGLRIAILRFNCALNFRESLAAPWLIANLLGELLPQNAQGERFYIVADRGGKLEEGARYSQTNQGGSYHTDSVNLKSGYDYFLLGCVAPAERGGESVLIDGFSVLRELRTHHPAALGVLSQDVIWEYKGIYEGRYYHEPIVKIANGNLVWRYLRDYIEGAAAKSGHPLTGDMIEAMDVLDAVLEQEHLQFRYALQAGETVIINDRSIFHGRSSFVDHVNAVPIETFLADLDCKQALKRTYSRMWVNRHQ